MSSKSRQQLESWLKTIDVQCANVLDIGGSQLPIQSRVKSWGENYYKIMDLSVPHETKQKPDFEFDLNEDLREMDFNEDDKLPQGLNRAWDVIFCLEVMEYVYNPLYAMRNIAFLLRSGGVAYISFHFLYPVHSPKQEDCLRYTEFGVRKLIEKSDLLIQDFIYRESEVSDPNTFYQAEGMRPAKDYDKHSAVGYLVKVIKP